MKKMDPHPIHVLSIIITINFVSRITSQRRSFTRFVAASSQQKPQDQSHEQTIKMPKTPKLLNDGMLVMVLCASLLNSTDSVGLEPVR